jgi:hypothetical protein
MKATFVGVFECVVLFMNPVKFLMGQMHYVEQFMRCCRSQGNFSCNIYGKEAERTEEGEVERSYSEFESIYISCIYISQNFVCCLTYKYIQGCITHLSQCSIIADTDIFLHS